MTDKIVLAFSGGLDTSYCVLDLVGRGFEVHTAFIDTGGVDDQGRAYIRDRAESLGAAKHHEIDVADQIWDEFVKPLVWSHARMLGEYPLLCSDRYLIVKSCLQLCNELGTMHFGHGCTGMGNDQLRFDQTVRSLGDYVIHAPIRDLQSKVQAVRDYELQVMADAGIPVEASASRYSINENLLGVTISGSEIDEYRQPADDAWTLTAGRDQWPAGSLEIRLGFEKGVTVSLDGEAMSGPEILQTLNRKLGAWGVGRHIYTGDVSIGLKGRIAFECPGIDALLTAHQALEDTVNTRFQNQFRAQISNRWAELVYTGFFYEPHKHDLEAYLHSSQQMVTGEVVLRTSGGSLAAVAVDSPYRLHNPDAVYAQSADWTPEEAVGFIKLLGQSTTLAGKVRGKAG
ncbi:MAG: argininosuccinate synthase [Xanthomonadales bacterium]|jgi:argininosuccinate synthase|nr:argininosuccinate synthase [Xanthomonadales bacterium]MDH3924550.1 argininosuccinate synthase [Xanthomonadales bacterium]MDH3941919.1 argininosuccinate synthase [Xanthomonadales bacterium]MDH4002309.1 argininosuccinate synthase [Xanthomonadales bacterium]